MSSEGKIILQLGVSCQVLRISLVAQMAKNLPAIQKTWVQSLVQKDPWEGNVYLVFLMQTANSLEKTLILGKIESRRRRG